MSKNRTTLYRIVITGFMAALVFLGNYLEIRLPSLDTRVHLGNSMPLLAGLLFGEFIGGFSAGIGAGLFDLLNPLYISSAPYTFFSKFAMGFTAGLIKHRGKNTDSPAVTVIAAVAGQIVYIILYLAKSFVVQLLAGADVGAALTVVGTKAVVSGINGALACVIAVPLYYAISAAIKKTEFGTFVTGKHKTAQ